MMKNMLIWVGIVFLVLLLLVGFVLAEDSGDDGDVSESISETGLAETASFNDGQPATVDLDQLNSIGVIDQRSSDDIFNVEGRTVVGSSVNPQFNSPGSGSQYFSPGMVWSDYGNEFCMPQQDLVLMIPPGGCKPAVVRSDLLEEQNVPVFCKISALQVNPLIGVSRVRSMSFPIRESTEGISGISYYPARTAIGGKRDLGSQIFNENMGYLVVTLQRQQNEDSMPDYVQGNITAVIDYESEGVLELEILVFIYLKQQIGNGKEIIRILVFGMEKVMLGLNQLKMIKQLFQYIEILIQKKELLLSEKERHQTLFILVVFIVVLV